MAIRENFSGTSDKLLGLELLRFTSAVCVLIFHYRQFFFEGTDGSGISNDLLPLYGWLPIRLPYRFGYLGVQVFWCVSGYIFFWKYRLPIQSLAVGGWNFMVLRFSRLYPLHLLTLLIVTGLQISYHRIAGTYHVYADNSFTSFLANLAMASNWFPWQQWSFNGPIWSISVEVLIYAFFFLSVHYLGANWKTTLAIFISASVGTILVDSTIFYCISFFYGGGLAALARDAITNRAKTRHSAGLSAVLLLLSCATFWKFRLYDATWFDWRHFLQVYAPMAVFCLAEEFRLLQKWSAEIQILGNMTYASYLIHFPVQLGVVTGFAVMGIGLPAASPWLLFSYVIAVLALSPLVFRYIELPAQNHIRRRFLAQTLAHGEDGARKESRA